LITVISIPPAEEHYDIDEFNDLYAKTKPTLYIKLADIFGIHKLLSQEIQSICPNQDDVLRDILRELGSVQSNESELRGVSVSEISLTLNPKLMNPDDPDAEVKALLTETKRCVLYIIRIQSAPSLLEILVKPVTPEDEDKWDALIGDEIRSGRRGAYTDATNHLDISTLSYPDLKRVALENVLHLESLGRLTRNNQYQDLLNAIAIDIRTKHRRRLQRQRELENVKTTLARLNEQAVYLEQQLKTYNDYIEQAMMTLQNKKGKKRFVMPFSKQWEHERELRNSGRSTKFGSFKYSARTLADKGVLVHWRGYQERQWDRVDLTISSNEVGVFTIDGSSGNMMIPGAQEQVPLDDLLQAQFNNTQFLEFFEGGALRVNVNLFLHLIMKKFYNE
jgi:Ras GTPase-activating-like protein IQGAP2/3